MNRTVVVYEPDSRIAGKVAQILEEGYEVVSASSSEELVALASQHLPWLIVMAEDAVESRDLFGSASNSPPPN